ncbi:MAG: long-chain fatty acid--CoA ligase [Deltaproteobacteria bacterium]|nr:long-chain fatty acid--CoA ligase [Deltaproteobacteria bacterium]
MSTGISYQAKPWLKHYVNGVPEDIEFEDVFLPDFLERWALKRPDVHALIFQGYKMSFKELKDKVDRLATSLSGFGIKKGDSVAILLPNVIPCVISYYAILRIGAIVVMNNPLYSDRELEHQFNDSGAKVLITLDLFCKRMTELKQKTGIRQIIYTSIGDYLPFPKNYLFKLVAKKKGLAADVKPAADVYDWKDILFKTSPSPPAVKLAFDDVAMYQYTGGTTGVSKGAMLTHRNISYNTQQFIALFPSLKGGKEVCLAAPPYFHAFGLTAAMNASIQMGWTQIVIPKPQPDELLAAIKKFKPTVVYLVPTMFIGILDRPDFDKVDMKFVKLCGSGGGALPVEVLKKIEKKTGCSFTEGYGMTEASPITHMNPFGGLTKPGSVGVPIPNTLARIVDLEDGETDVPVGEIGEIVFQGPQVMKGYLNMPDETANALKGGWLHSGDIGKMDEDGYFYVVDRKKDMVISGGYNVYPLEIERVYDDHPKTAEAAAIGVPHPTRGEQVKLIIVLKEGESATEEEIIKYCSDKLAKYKWPTIVEFRSELPRSAIGKLLKHILREE